MKKVDWEDEIRTLDLFINDVLKSKRNRNTVLDRIEEYEIQFVTVSDIKAFIKKHILNDKDIRDEDIIKFLMDEENKEILQRFGQYKNPIDTKFNDYIYNRYKAMDDDNYMEIY